ncbi:hypothetical protein BSKO_07073 [Bryopsis sp. KO-2023]|nr:hypothetical protein BSKO_07073 [Bryopsis sp. KO-2023]
MAEPRRDFSYMEGWGDEFHEEADVELVVEGVAMVAHSTILSQSDILRSAIRDTSNPEGRIKIESLFAECTVADVDLFLSQVYVTSQRIPEDQLPRVGKIMDLAMRCGFHSLANRALNTLTNSQSVYGGGFASKLQWMKPEEMCYWLDICNKTGHEGLEKAFHSLLSTNHLFTSTPEWASVQTLLEKNPKLMVSILRTVSAQLRRWEDGSGFNLEVKCQGCSQRSQTLSVERKPFCGMKSDCFIQSNCPHCREYKPFVVELVKRV